MPACSPPTWAGSASTKHEPHRRSPTESRCPPRASVRQKSMHFRSINRCFRRSPNSVLPNDVSKRRTAALGGHHELSRAHAHGAKSGFENSRRHRARAASTSKVAPGPPPRPASTQSARSWQKNARIRRRSAPGTTRSKAPTLSSRITPVQRFDSKADCNAMAGQRRISSFFCHDSALPPLSPLCGGSAGLACSPDGHLAFRGPERAHADPGLAADQRPHAAPSQHARRRRVAPCDRHRRSKPTSAPEKAISNPTCG